MKRPAPRKPRIPGLTNEVVREVLGYLQTNYANVNTYVMNRTIRGYLPVLRALEVAGFVRIIRLDVDKRWIATPAGAIWLHMQGAVNKATFSIDQDILVEPFFGWMTCEEAGEAARHLVTHKFATAQDVHGVPISYYHMQSVVLTPRRSEVPGREAYARFYRFPDPMEQYG